MTHFGAKVTDRILTPHRVKNYASVIAALTLREPY